MIRRITGALLLGAVCFGGITVAFFGIYVARLYASGFPPLDVQLDRQVFASHVFPIAAMGASIFFFGNLTGNGGSVGSTLRGVISVSIPVIVAVTVFDRITSGIAVSNLSRGLFGCACAFAFFIVISCRPRFLRNRT
jgi:hypothetical protein